jgi:hypothetical protein
MADTPHSILLRMIRGFQLSQMIYAVAKLGIADLLANGPKSVDELAQATLKLPRAKRRRFIVCCGHWQAWGFSRRIRTGALG